jgi:hypothetical protein
MTELCHNDIITLIDDTSNETPVTMVAASDNGCSRNLTSAL